MPKVGGDSPARGVWREEETPKARGQKGKGFGIRLIWFWPPTLLLACWVTLDVSLTLCKHVFPHILKKKGESVHSHQASDAELQCEPGSFPCPASYPGLAHI